LYGSQTGKSEKFAEKTFNLFKKVFNTKISTINNYDFDVLNGEDLVLFVASSTGNGEAPTNAQTIEQSIENYKKTGEIDEIFRKDFKNTKFSTLGLGNSNYAKFCEFPKSLHNFMKSIGLKEMHSFAAADELWEEEKSCYQWLRETFKSSLNEFQTDLKINQHEIAEILNSKEINKNKLKLRLKKIKKDCMKTKVKDCKANLSSIFDKEINEFELVEKRVLVKDGDENSVLKITLKPSDQSINYRPGDHIEIYPKNPQCYVESILNKIKESDPTLNFDEPYIFEALDHEATNGNF
jgi:sulfite reductase alpha subunit-like flavoprotein